MESYYSEIGTSRQAIAQSILRETQLRTEEGRILKLVKECRKKHPKMGSRALYYTIENIEGKDIGIGVTKFEKLMSKGGLTNARPIKKWIKTSDGLGKGSYPNLINGMEINAINQLIVGDITYYKMKEELCYIFILKDMYSQKILGLVPALTMEAKHGLHCLKDALYERKGQELKGCIHHTDNGSQYNAKVYIQCLTDVGMKISRANNCLENGGAENLNSLVKNMYLIPWEVSNYKELKEACKELKYNNNELRAVKELDNLSPNQYEKIVMKLSVNERPIKKLYDFES
jgi:putative transposase